MSAPQSQVPSGPSSTTPNNSAAAPAPRKRPPVSIFTQKKKPLRKPAPLAGAAAQGVPKPSDGSSAAKQNGNTPAATAPTATDESSKYIEYPIYINKSAFTQGRHFHAMKLQARLNGRGVPMTVNPFDESQFTRPIRLHRRHARDKMEVAATAAEQSDAAASGADDPERERLNQRRAERKAEREANQALIAPTGAPAEANHAKKNNAGGKKKAQKKVEDVYYNANDPRQRARAQLRYEEARPWHLEDFDNKNIWVGSYEEPLSETSVLFETTDSAFTIAPVEKWYRFTQNNRVTTMDSDAVEKHMGKKFKPPRWFLGTQAANDEERKRAMQVQREQQRAQVRRFDEDDEAPSFMKNEEYRADVDEIDFEFNDEFQDDDEGLIFGDQQDDDAKEIEKKIREEMRTANLGGTGVKDEDRDWDEEEQKERREEQEEKRRTKRMRKQLIKKERKNEYDSESDHGEFSEDSETEDSEEEREKAAAAEEEQRKREEEARKVNGDKSGASSKGTNTPTGRVEKKDQTRLGPSLKRPGSPDLSEMSGNESSRKKAKGINGAPVAGGARGPSGKPKHLRAGSPGGYGSGSDTDASRSGRPRIKIKHSPSASPAPGGSPSGSRAGSPGASPQRKNPAPGSTLAPPAVGPASPALPFPTLQEIRDAIPPEGISIQNLARDFRSRVLSRNKEFIALVSQAGKQHPVTKMIMRKPEEDGA